MATYTIGDIHGCWQTLQALLRQLPWNEDEDHLWLVGDLVNRGPQSLATLRWAKERAQELGPRFQAVLGNHDLHLLASAAGLRGRQLGDTLDPILDAADREPLLQWLAALPFLIHRDDRLLVHAGLHPRWRVDDAIAAAHRLQRALRNDGLATLVGPKTAKTHRQERSTLRILTRLRTWNPSSDRPGKHKGTLDEMPVNEVPWFQLGSERRAGTTVIFGHWAALGVYVDDRVLGLDGGCVWGGEMVAMRLEDRALFRQRRLD